ncbi:MAG: CMP-N-acetylneuraminic acid synthetase [Parasporobacterium sp.]|nr:CMP-N-acetylneuraminic acid synthetase [Parasporobacterium sp.]
MKTAAFVPVKLNNERAPGKNTKRFSDGTPLITLFLKTLVQVKEIDELYVFCSKEEIKDYLIPGVTFLKRPEYLDTKTATPQDIIDSFMEQVNADVYAVCHCTSPFVTAEHISECFKNVCSRGYDSAFTAEKIQRLMWCDGKPLNFEAENVPRTQDLPVYYNEVSAAYVFTKETFVNLRRRIGNHPYICEVSGIESVDIDYPEDFEIADVLYTNYLKERTDRG